MPLQRPKPQCPGSLGGYFGAGGAWPQSASQDSPEAVSHQASGWEFPAQQLCRGSTCWDDTRADPGLSWVLGQVGCCAWEAVPCFGAVCSQRASRQSQPVLGRPKWPGQPPQQCQGSGGSSQNPPTRAGDGPVGSATWILHPRSGQRVLVAPWAELNFAFCGPVSNQRSGKPVNFSSPWGSRQLGP